MANKRVPSIMETGEAKCYICGAPWQRGLERHHAIPGRGNRKICDEWGLTIHLCSDCHRKLHDESVEYKKIKADAQRAFIKNRIG